VMMRHCGALWPWLRDEYPSKWIFVENQNKNLSH